MIFAIILIAAPAVPADFSLEVESGMVFNGYNDIQIPKESGTRFSLTDDFSVDEKIYFRFRGGWRINPKSEFKLLIAPLTLKAEGRSDREIVFEGETFQPDTELEGTYRFNSYRLTYRYYLASKEKIEFALGFSAKIRDAIIRLESAGQISEKTDLGFVPLLNFYLDYRPAKRWHLTLEGDALAGPQGRAEDVLLAVRYQFGNNLTAFSGYRILEGGADVDAVYNFTLLHYLALGVTVSF
jgi:hypothetical protein